MDEILQHLKNHRMMIPLYMPTNNGFPWFSSGAEFRPSTVRLIGELPVIDLGKEGRDVGHAAAGKLISGIAGANGGHDKARLPREQCGERVQELTLYIYIYICYPPLEILRFLARTEVFWPDRG